MKVGPRASGKTSLVKLVAGCQLDILNTNSSMGKTELWGGFQQVNVLYFLIFFVLYFYSLIRIG